MATRNAPVPKEGKISQRVPLSTEKKMKRLAKHSKLPESVCLQLIVEAEYKRVFNTK